ncbi:MAG: TIGR02301 family protein [Hyphomicrobiaceae bacterium]|nr:TIGR02301 family protein [Hyphomicrobiaceae bacterium]
MPRPFTRACLASALRPVAAAAVLLACASAASAQDARPYDEKLLRLSEVLGAVHYLRELCGADEGQLWRDRMRELMDAEGTSALRRARLTRSFNKGYQGYSRTYRTCTPSAQTAVTRFLAEATQIADGLVHNVP